MSKLNWLFRSIRWRAVAAYNIGWWVMFLGAPMKDWIPIGNRGEVIKWAWEFYRGQEFPGQMLTVAEVMPIVMGHKGGGQLKYHGFAVDYHSDGTKRIRKF